MKRMYAPWRGKYTTTAVRSKKPDATAEECVFCEQFAQNKDSKYFILKRYKHNAVMLNKFPYNAGHLLIIPFDHKATLDQLSKAARTELMELIALSSHIVGKTLQAEGRVPIMSRTGDSFVSTME